MNQAVSGPHPLREADSTAYLNNLRKQREGTSGNRWEPELPVSQWKLLELDVNLRPHSSSLALDTMQTTHFCMSCYHRCIWFVPKVLILIFSVSVASAHMQALCCVPKAPCWDSLAKSPRSTCISALLWFNIF